MDQGSLVRLDKQRLFARHHPLPFDLHLSGEQPLKQVWSLHDSWICYEPSQQLLSPHYDFDFHKLSDEDFNVNSIHHALEKWSQAVECAVDKTIASQHKLEPEWHPTLKLPRRCKGRCRQAPCVKKPFSQSIKQAWGGQHTPNVDSSSHGFILMSLGKPHIGIPCLKQIICHEGSIDVWHIYLAINA